VRFKDFINPLLGERHSQAVVDSAQAAVVDVLHVALIIVNSN